MTEDRDFDALRAALRSSPPPRDGAGAKALDRALAAFDEVQGQGTAKEIRPNHDRPVRAGFGKGLIAMLDTLKLKPVLAATTSAAALGLALFAVLPNLPAMVGEKGTATRPDAANAVDAEATAPATLAAPAAAPSTAPPTATELANEMAPEPELEMAPEMAPARLREEAPAARKAAPALEPQPGLATMPEAADAMADSAGAMMAPEMVGDAQVGPVENTESYANAAPNPVRITADEPVSTFSIDVDTASYAIIRSSLNSGFLPDPEAVRVEEMVNYFPYGYPGPEAQAAPFRPGIAVFQTPWNPDTRLVRIALQGRLPVAEARPPLNLVFLVDTSGSMDDPAKLPLLRQSLALLLPQLRAQDEVAIVAYAGSAGEVLPPTPATDRAAILEAMDRLSAGGGTAGGEGLELAYRVASRMQAAGEVSRVLLATDGDFNLGLSDPEGLGRYVARKREEGTYLSVLGFGRGNLDDATMQALAQNGNGTASYIDTLQEARKVLVDQLTGALFPIADDVKIQVEWNPAAVAEYRLIGYETRALPREAFNNDRIDAGEIGAGHQVTALYEITAPGSPALRNDPLRYGAPADSVAPATGGEELGFLRLRYKAPGAATSDLIETPITAQSGADEDALFAAAIAGFGQLLRGSTDLGDWGWDEAIALAGANRGEDAFGYRIEAVNLMRLARDLSR